MYPPHEEFGIQLSLGLGIPHLSATKKRYPDPLQWCKPVVGGCVSVLSMTIAFLYMLSLDLDIRSTTCMVTAGHPWHALLRGAVQSMCWSTFHLLGSCAVVKTTTPRV